MKRQGLRGLWRLRLRAPLVPNLPAGAVCFRVMNWLAISFISLLALPVAAQTAVATTQTAPPAGFKESIVLWPDGAPLAHGKTDGDIPKLFTYPAAGAGPHNAVIVMPGGGYTHLVMEQEGAYEARWLAAHGVSAFVLEYRLAPAYMYPVPMLDASRAVKYVRSHAAELGVKPDAIGVWGFSAGGHLSAYMATVHKAGDPAAKDPVDRVSDRPDFAILSYAGLNLELNVQAGKVPLEPILGPHPKQAEIDAVNPIKHVSKDTCPVFLYSTELDEKVDSRNDAEFFEKLKVAGVPAEMHIFQLGQHGTHMGENLPPNLRELTVTPVLISNWMELHGWMAEQPE
jgi:acetyl esterase/lipase